MDIRAGPGLQVVPDLWIPTFQRITLFADENLNLLLKHPAFIAVLGNEQHLTVQLAGNLLTSPEDRAAGAAVGEKQGRVIYFPSCAGKRPVHGRFTGFPGGVRRAVMRCRTVQQHTVDGVTIRYPLMGWRFAIHRRGGRVSRPHRLAVPRVSRPTGADRAAEVIPIWYIWVQAWRMWNHMPGLLWILEGLAVFNVVKLTILKLAGLVFLSF